MRQIDVRVWGVDLNGEGKREMYYLEDIGDTDISRRAFHLWEDLDINELNPWMLWTGLKDRNGKKIYDGDIVKMDEEAKIKPNENLVIEEYFGMYYAHPVGDRFFVGNIHELCVDMIGNYKPKHGVAGTIIGNIYENPDLISKMKENVNHQQ